MGDEPVVFIQTLKNGSVPALNLDNRIWLVRRTYKRVSLPRGVCGDMSAAVLVNGSEGLPWRRSFC